MQKRRSIIPAVLALCTILSRAANAQLVSGVELGTRSARSSADRWRSQVALSPTFQFDRGRTSLVARGTVAGWDGGELDGDGLLAASAFTPSRFGLRGELTTFAERSMLTSGLPVSAIGAAMRLSYRRGSSGLWAGRDVVRDNWRTALPPAARLSFGAWRQMGNALVTLDVGTYGARTGARASTLRHQTVLDTIGRDTLGYPQTRWVTRTFGDSGSAGMAHEWTDSRTSFHWARGRVALDAMFGIRLYARNEPLARWGEVDATYALGQRLALVAGGGVKQASLVYGSPGSRFLSLGVRVAPTALLRPRISPAVRPVPAAFDVRPAARGAYLVRVRVPRARIVELTGDFTAWKPVTLQRAEGDVWEITLPIPPGTHRVNIRVDGDAWTIPPGTTSVVDEFSGKVGVIVIPG